MSLLRWVLPAFVAVLSLTAAPNDDFKPLFNGKDLDGWVVEGVKEYPDGDQMKPVWTVQDGTIVCTGKGFGFLRYDKQPFDNFAFRVEYRMAPKCNSGIGIRTTVFDSAKSKDTRPSYYSYEIQLTDDAGKPASKHSTGSLYRYVAPKVSAAKPAGEWNRIDIECVGPRIRVTLNDQEIINVDQTTIEETKNKPLKGYVCLQNHGGKIEFRNITIREIKAVPIGPGK
jgi:hypothetical protein